MQEEIETSLHVKDNDDSSQLISSLISQFVFT